MRAFVLSGGANYGAQQVGALEVLLENSIQPDMVMGVSAGALNAAWVAMNPTLDGVQELARIWREDAAMSIPPVGPLTALLRLIGGKDRLAVQRFAAAIPSPLALCRERVWRVQPPASVHGGGEL